jgi:hypothetical protein
MIAIIILASSLAKHLFGPTGRRMKLHASRDAKRTLEASRIEAEERARARELYERLVREKLEVVKDAIAMGYSEAELDRLDARLEELIGREQLQRLLSEKPEAPTPDADLMDTDLLAEAERLKRPREGQRD